MAFTLCSLVIHFDGMATLPSACVCILSFESERQSTVILYSEVFAVDPCAATDECMCSAGVDHLPHLTGGKPCRVICSGWTERGRSQSKLVGSVRASLLCACAVSCVFICADREDEGGGVWSVGQGGRGDSQLRGLWTAAAEIHKINKTTLHTG